MEVNINRANNSRYKSSPRDEIPERDVTFILSVYLLMLVDK